MRAASITTSDTDIEMTARRVAAAATIKGLHVIMYIIMMYIMYRQTLMN